MRYLWPILDFAAVVTTGAIILAFFGVLTAGFAVFGGGADLATLRDWFKVGIILGCFVMSGLWLAERLR